MRWHEEMGQSAEYIAREYDLSLGDVYAALAYYYDHKEEMDARARADEAFVEEMMRDAPSLVVQGLGRLRRRDRFMAGMDSVVVALQSELPWWARTLGSFREQGSKYLY